MMGSDFYQHVKILLLDTQKGVSLRPSKFLQVVEYCLLSGVTYTAVVNHVVFLVVME
jgi:predicted type IV restriction endonuclease